jgi:hypothetical protein
MDQATACKELVLPRFFRLRLLGTWEGAPAEVVDVGEPFRWRFLDEGAEEAERSEERSLWDVAGGEEKGIWAQRGEGLGPVANGGEWNEALPHSVRGILDVEMEKALDWGGRETDDLVDGRIGVLGDSSDSENLLYTFEVGSGEKSSPDIPNDVRRDVAAGEKC